MTLLTSGGKLVYPFVLHTPENYAAFVECCCGGGCCAILVNFATLKVTITCRGETTVFHPTGGGGNPGSVSWSGESLTFAEFPVEDFVFTCTDDAEGNPIYRVTAVLSNSAPCEQVVDETINQPAPCCPLDVTFTVTPGDCCSDMTIRVQTKDDIVCPE